MTPAGLDEQTNHHRRPTPQSPPVIPIPKPFHANFSPKKRLTNPRITPLSSQPYHTHEIPTPLPIETLDTINPAERKTTQITLSAEIH
jgi:hypothetical protein